MTMFWAYILLFVLLFAAAVAIYIICNYPEACEKITRHFMRRMGFFIIILLIASISDAQDLTSIAEDPPLYAVTSSESGLPIIEAIDPAQPIAPPDAFPRAAELIVSIIGPQDVGSSEDINWTAFYKGFRPLEMNLTKNITMLRA